MSTNMNFEIAGEGDPVLFIHGLGGTANVWGPQVGILSRFSRCIRMDLPGSGRNMTTSPLALVALADELASHLQDSLIEQTHVVAHSMGTVIAQHLAVRHPGLVKSLALLGPLIAPPDPARAALRDRALKARSEGMIPIADAIVQGGTSAETKAHRPEIAAFVRELLMAQDTEGYARTCEALAAVEPAEIERINCPVLLVTGDEDLTAPPRTVINMAKKIPAASVKILDRCGHWTPLEKPSQVNATLVNFLLTL